MDTVLTAAGIDCTLPIYSFPEEGLVQSFNTKLSDNGVAQ